MFVLLNSDGAILSVAITQGKMREYFFYSLVRAHMPPLEILLPESKRSGTDPKYAAMLIDCLSSSDAPEQLLEVSGVMILSGNQRLRDVMTMVLRAKRFELFLKELESALFPSASGMGELRCIREGSPLAYQITQLKPLPNLKWKITRAP